MMPKIVLYRPAATTNVIVPPWGLLYISASLMANGYDVEIIDEIVQPNWKKREKEIFCGNIICVGVSVLTGSYIYSGLEFSKYIKKKRNIPIIWGGVHPTLLPEQTLRNALIDALVLFEGEETFLELVRAIHEKRRLENIPGIAYKDGSTIHITSSRNFIDISNFMKIPYHLIKIEKYIQNMEDMGANRVFEMITSRGCPWRCGFCYGTKFNRHQWRAMTSDRVLSNLRKLIYKFKLDGIFFRDDNFFVNKSRVEEICQGLIRENFNIKWASDCRIDTFSNYKSDFIKILKNSGLVKLVFGVESGNQRILDFIHKDITLEQVRKVNRVMRDWGIRAVYHFMSGFPDETKDEIIQTYEFISQLLKENSNIEIYGPSIYTPYPGTYLYRKCQEFGLKSPATLSGWSKYEWSKSKLPWMSVNFKNFLETIESYHRAGYYHSTFRKMFLLRLKLFKKSIATLVIERYLLKVLRKVAYWRRGFFIKN